MTAKKRTKDAVKILEKRYVGKSRAKQEALAAEREKAEVAAQLYKIRTEAALTQTELARLVGTTQSVISLLEDADYGGQSLSMLRKIAHVLNYRVEVHFVRAGKRGLAV